jgi:hypothetical protein
MRQHPRRKHTKQRAEKSRTRRVRATCIGYPPVGLLRDAHTTRQCHRQPYYVTVNLARVGEGGAVSGEHNHGGHFWVRHVSIAHSRSACGATRFLQELAPCSRLPCQSRRCGKVPPGRGSHMLFAGGRPRPGLLLSACIRAAAQAHGCGEPRARACKKATAQRQAVTHPGRDAQPASGRPPA